ncbi:MAG: M23 family metallopeptidase, partial [Candidatus Eremiobacteraeota bacterium]|nr:M23 family metallopeptidase [Candidatus Eremiobacteraeota bacterium]
ITSPFGWRIHPISGVRSFHEGLDIGVASGTPIGAAEAGRVIYAGWYGGYGNYISIDHGGGVSTGYAHCSAIYVSVGQDVRQGQTIGAVGSTGYSTGPHLHFEVRINGKPVDPLTRLR